MNKIKTVILCGGIGYRLKEETEFKPKPMVEIGGKPILWHIMKIYAHYGFSDFVIALGYKGNIIKDYFVNNKFYRGDFLLNTKSHKVTFYKNKSSENFNITFVDTGLESLTGERVRRLQKYIDSDNFMVTYGDGLADINITKLLKFHKNNSTIATVTAVNPILKYGGFEIGKKDLATEFNKKAIVKQFINGGFMVFKRKIFDYISKESMIEDAFSELIEKKQLALHKHKGFFHAMDTYQDMQELNVMWNENPGWKVWD